MQREQYDDWSKFLDRIWTSWLEKKWPKKEKKRETGGPRYYRQVNEPGALWNVNVLLRHVRLPWSEKGVKETKGKGGGKECETTKNGVARYTIVSRIQITESLP